MTGSSATEAAIQTLIRASNRAWREGNTEDLRQLLHPDVAFVGPRLQVLAEGRDACIRSYEDFVSRAEIHAFDEQPAEVRITGSTAVATYEWTIAYTMGGQRHDERGHEMLVCVRTDAGWQIVWRAQFRAEK